MAITITENAVAEIKKVIAQQNLSPDSTYLRLGVKGGGCSGFTYSLDLATVKGEHDEEFVQDGIKCICDPKSYIYLEGVTLDFKEGLMGRGFVFNNPNATSTCGCGSSFSA